MANFFKKWDTKTWIIVAFGGVATIAGAAFIMQSKHAALGRQVHRNVTKFLIDHGSKIHGGVISGGLVSTPMKTNIAVNSTVVSMLNGYADIMGNMPNSSPATSEEEQVITGRTGVQGVGLPNTGGPGANLKTSPGSPSPVPTSPRTSRAPATIALNPTDRAVDDGGYTSSQRVPSEYNPHEFTPTGNKPSGDIDLFAGDGIPSNVSGTRSSSSAVGYE